MSAPVPEVDAGLVEALAGHGLSWRRVFNGIDWRCECGDTGHVGASFHDAEAAYNTHLARAVQGYVEGQVAAEVAARSAEVWWDRGRKQGQPCISGTRVTTAMVAEAVNERPDGDVNAMEMWNLTAEQVEGAVAFEAWLAGEREKAHSGARRSPETASTPDGGRGGVRGGEGA